MPLFHRTNPRREQLRKDRPDMVAPWYERLLRPENYGGLIVVGVFVLLTSSILMLRPQVVRYRPGQWVPHDLVARVDFLHHDIQKLNSARADARDHEPRIYRQSPDQLKKLNEDLTVLPDQLQKIRLDQLPENYRDVFDNATLAQVQGYADHQSRAAWKDSVDAYVSSIRKMRLVILPETERAADLDRMIVLPELGPVPANDSISIVDAGELERRLGRIASDNFSSTLSPKILKLTLRNLKPTHTLDDAATTQARNRAFESVPDSAGDESIKANMIMVRRGELTASDFSLLRDEQLAYLDHLGGRVWWQRLGLIAVVLMVTAVMMGYIQAYQPRIIRNHARAAGLAGLMLAMLLLSQLTALSTSQIYLVGIAPTIIVAMILAIAYDQRFAIGIGAVHAVLATLALGQDMSFLMILIAGVVVCCFLLDDVRTRSRLIEVGGATALAMMVATVASGWLAMDRMAYIVKNAIYSGAAGLAVGFIVLGILPFIERVFRITTSMTLLELADASHPLLRRLALEAPGTYNHSLQVAILAEEAAEAIGGNSLLCRVASYYHDVGKINKSEYFIENQQQGENRHLNLNPSVSLLIIIGHVKDGVELAKEYALPTNFVPFIQQHHGTTIVEFFYRRAKDELDPNDPLEQPIEEHQYRYPGPKPRSKEVAITMMADACESACRAIDDPSASQIEDRVHKILMARLLDGQFDESDITMRELELVERSLVKTLLGIYHGRIAYPTDAPTQQPHEATQTHAIRSA